MRAAVGTVASTVLATAASVVALTALAPGVARAQIAWARCGTSNEFACAHLTVGLDPGAPAGGVITLAMRRHRAPVGDEREAVIALAGGPGQPALPFVEQFVRLLGPILATRDLIVFDQRGLGLSHPLACHRFEQPVHSNPPGRAIAECAGQLGDSRAFFQTADTVADIEAIRQAGGYERLVLYGTSFGTKVAERYAQAYPARVAALVLDSVVPPSGPDPLNRSTFAAIPRILHQLCARRACAHITTSPFGDLAKVVARMRRRALRARWIDGHGKPRHVVISARDLLETLLEGDFEPGLRAELPGALRSAAQGDLAALARLSVNARESAAESEAESPADSFDAPLYYATTCEEEPFPFSRSAPPAERMAQARRAVQGQARAFRPFPAGAVLGVSDVPACVFWPFASPPPATLQAPFPTVPTLLLSGAEDLRTPTANAREVAAQIPGSHLLVVPDVGHSVLGAETGGCAAKALQALFASSAIKPCRAAAGPALTPRAPPRLSDVSPIGGHDGRAGRTLHAVTLTLADFLRQATRQALGALSGRHPAGASALRVGGLRAGWAAALDGALVLHGYSYVPGVTVSGRIGARHATLRVGGSAAARGELHGGRDQLLRGKLAGTPVRLPHGTPPGLGIVEANAQASPRRRRERAFAVRAAARRPAGRVAGLR
jgi:pimeloyl-ACP methyl ester carboxylesterase